MRVTDRMNFDQVNMNLQKNRSEMADLQNQAATQKRLNKPSDDPVGAARVLSTRSEDRGLKQFVKNIHQARNFLEVSDQALSEVSEILVRMKELAIQQANDAGANDETRRVAAEEVGQSFSQTIQIANRKLGERYIFGGHQTTATPFNKDGNYAGDDGDMHVLINKDASISMNMPGSRIFVGQGISADGRVRPRTEQPKNAKEVEEFQINEMKRDRDMIRTQEDELRLRAPASSRGRVELQLETPTAPDQQGVNVMQVIKGFELALRTDDKEEIQHSIDTLDTALNQIIQSRAQVGARVQTLNQTQESLQKSLVDNKGMQSEIEDADLFQTVSDITKTDSTLRATLETSGKLVQSSLLDFLR